MFTVSEDKNRQFRCSFCNGESFSIVERVSVARDKIFGWEVKCLTCRKRYALRSSLHISTNYETVALEDIEST
jgi:transcription elongation factor Elf1